MGRSVFFFDQALQPLWVEVGICDGISERMRGSDSLMTGQVDSFEFSRLFHCLDLKKWLILVVYQPVSEEGRPRHMKKAAPDSVWRRLLMMNDVLRRVDLERGDCQLQLHPACELFCKNPS